MIIVRVNKIIPPPNNGIVFMDSTEELQKILDLKEEVVMFVDDDNNKWFFSEDTCYVIKEKEQKTGE